MASVTIPIGPEGAPFGTIELVTFEATFTSAQTRSSTGTGEPVATVTIRARDWNWIDTPPAVGP